MCGLLSDRKSVIHWQVESGTLSWESLSCSRAGMMVLKAELKSTNYSIILLTIILSLLFLRECVCFSLLLHCVFECQVGTTRAALLLSLPKRLSFRLLVRWLRQDSCFLHLSLKCFRSLIPVAVQIVSVPGLWNNRQGHTQNATL